MGLGVASAGGQGESRTGSRDLGKIRGLQQEPLQGARIETARVEAGLESARTGRTRCRGGGAGPKGGLF